MNGRLLFLFVMISLPLYADQTKPADSLRVCSIQMEITDRVDTNLQQIMQGIQTAAQSNARIAVFPEMALSGFSANAVKSLNWEQVNLAMQDIASQSKKHNLYIIYGCATPSQTERPYNTAIVVAPDGNEVIRYHKMFPEKWFEPGDALALFEIDGILCTLMICHDERFPELVRIPVLNGAQVCFYISYEINSLPDALRKMDGYRAQLLARAVENQIWMVQSNGVGPLDGAKAVSLGQSRIIAPDGLVLKEAPAMKSHTMIQDITPSLARRSNAIETFNNETLAKWWRSAFPLIKHGRSTP